MFLDLGYFRSKINAVTGRNHRLFETFNIFLVIILTYTRQFYRFSFSFFAETFGLGRGNLFFSSNVNTYQMLIVFKC